MSGGHAPGLTCTKELGLNEKLFGQFVFIWPLSDNFSMELSEKRVRFTASYSDICAAACSLFPNLPAMSQAGYASAGQINLFLSVMDDQQSEITITTSMTEAVSMLRRRSAVLKIRCESGAEVACTDIPTALRLVTLFLKKKPCGIRVKWIIGSEGQGV